MLHLFCSLGDNIQENELLRARSDEMKGWTPAARSLKATVESGYNSRRVPCFLLDSEGELITEPSF